MKFIEVKKYLDTKKINSKAFKNLENEAIDGNILAQGVLAIKSVENTYKMKKSQAFKWLIAARRKSSKKFEGSIEEAISFCYLYGYGVKSNDHLAFLNLLNACKYKRPWSINCLGDCYFEGIGTKQSYSKAFKVYSSIPPKDREPSSWLRLGYISFYGLNGKPSPTLAIKYYQKAYKLGEADGGFNLLLMLLNSNKKSSLVKARSIGLDLIKREYKKSVKVKKLLIKWGLI